MLRKASAVLAMTMVVTTAACTSITGPAANRAPQPGNSTDKVCSDDEQRIVEVTGPVEEILHNGRSYLVALQTENFCARYSVVIEVSKDGGITYEVLARGDNLASALWTVPNERGVRPVVRISASDAMSSGQTARAFEFTYDEPGGRGRGHHDWADLPN